MSAPRTPAQERFETFLGALGITLVIGAWLVAPLDLWAKAGLAGVALLWAVRQ